MIVLWNFHVFFCLHKSPAFILARHFPVSMLLMFIDPAAHEQTKIGYVIHDHKNEYEAHLSSDRWRDVNLETELAKGIIYLVRALNEIIQRQFN